MKKTILLFTVVSFTTFLQAQQVLTNSQQAIQQTVVKMFDALSNRDSVALKLYCAGDITLYEYGLSWNMDTLIAKAITLNTSSDFKRINTIDFINTTAHNNIAWATYDLHSAITRDGKQATVQWMETVILIKDTSKWKIKVLHSTLIKRN